MTSDKYIYAGDDGASISVSLRHSDGTPVDLSTAVDARLIVDSLLDNSATIVNAEEGKLRYDFTPEDLVIPGNYEAVFRVTFPEGVMTYPSLRPFTLTIANAVDDLPDIEDSLTFITPSQVFSITNKHATLSDIIEAQGLISTFIERDLNDSVFVSSLSVRDDLRIRQAIAYQAVHVHDNLTNVTVSNPVKGLTSISQGDVSMTFSETTNEDMVVSQLAPLAYRLLTRLSWLNTKTIKPRSMFDQPSNVPINRYFYYQPIVRGPAPDYLLWDSVN